MATKKFTRKEIAEKDPKSGIVIIIENMVYDVTQFLDEHPGGHEILVNQAGKDASEDFHDVGHSLTGQLMMKEFEVGEIVEEEHRPKVTRSISGWEITEVKEQSFLSSWKVPLIAGILFTVIYSYLFG